ncbi:MAG: DUF4126 family protein [Gemmatimonadota bacterium]|nr:DUF4126 family protein [Gemmatimonadota bacterium]
MPIHSAFFFCASALLLGVVSGMRTMVAPAVLALTLSRRPELVPPATPAHWFTLSAVAVPLGLAALGELIGDKLPQTPNRTALAPFLARVASGAICGAAMVQLGLMDKWLGAGFGAVGAATGAIGMFHLRRYAGRVSRISDPYIGAIEDALAIAIAATVLALTLG